MYHTAGWKLASVGSLLPLNIPQHVKHFLIPPRPQYAKRSYCKLEQNVLKNNSSRMQSLLVQVQLILKNLTLGKAWELSSHQPAGLSQRLFML